MILFSNETSICQILTGAGHEAFEATDGQGGIEKALTIRPVRDLMKCNYSHLVAGFSGMPVFEFSRAIPTASLMVELSEGISLRCQVIPTNRTLLSRGTFLFFSGRWLRSLVK